MTIEGAPRPPVAAATRSIYLVTAGLAALLGAAIIALWLVPRLIMVLGVMLSWVAPGLVGEDGWPAPAWTDALTTYLLAWFWVPALPVAFRLVHRGMTDLFAPMRVSALHHGAYTALAAVFPVLLVLYGAPILRGLIQGAEANADPLFTADAFIAPAQALYLSVALIVLFAVEHLIRGVLHMLKPPPARESAPWLSDRPLAVLTPFNERMCRLFGWVASALVGFMVLVVLVQVLIRYLINELAGALDGWSSGEDWIAALLAFVEPFLNMLSYMLSSTEETAVYLMLWMTFLVAPIAYRQGLNVSLELFISFLKKRAATVLFIVMDIAVLVLLVYLYDEALSLIDRSWRTMANTIDIPRAYLFLVLPLGYIAMFLVGIERILKGVRDTALPPAPDPSHDPPADQTVAADAVPNTAQR